MPFKKGDPSINRSGRKKGTPNKNTLILSGLINYLIDGGFDKFKSEINKLDGKDYIYAFMKLLNLPNYVGGDIAANQKLIEFLNEKSKEHGTN